jgi:hypothetical protein
MSYIFYDLVIVLKLNMNINDRIYLSNRPLIQPMLLWKGETIKDVYPNLPIIQIIEKIKINLPSGLRRVTRTNQTSPSY